MAATTYDPDRAMVEGPRTITSARQSSADAAQQRRPPLAGTSSTIRTTEIRIPRSHPEKAIGDNRKRALDADNLRMEFAMPNAYREIIQARHPEVRALTE